ncbi:S8 family peptidase [Halobacterium litoreum]|uniref:S8 family serine peptidase n=1 Tax=Halobacterium litoreum TaxID=2039234 RepID=A0ABD5N9W4_9EURY|nr:S8 family serine peptidase [Halobacterium litoreum]UHH12004.1 S8 family serine peptidase [Halobacterium litoreum]
MARFDRRTFLKGTGAALGGLAFGTGAGVASASGDAERFLVDLRQVDRSALPDDATVVHDISEIDALVVRGDPDAVPSGTAVVPDVAVFQDDAGPAAEHAGPSANGADNHNFDGPASNAELQWDKRVQDVENLTDKPGNGRVVHDTTEGEGTRIAVVDSGVYDAHPDLEAVVNEDLSENFTTDGYDFRPNGAGSHGTHVAGTIAATNDNDGEAGGVLGTAPKTEIVALRVFSGVSGATGDTIAALVDAANKGCDAANISLGYPRPYIDPAEYPWLLLVREMYRRAAEYARENDMVIVNSAGNGALDMDREGVLSLPTEVEGIFGVSATGPIGYGWGDKHDDNEEKWLTGNRLEEPTTQPANYTNYGSAVDVSAGGGNYDPEALASGQAKWYYDLVFSTTVTTYYEDGPDEDDTGDKPSEIVDTEPSYGWKAGTSMAAPQVSGAVALVRSLRPDASAAEVEDLIRETASQPEEGERYHGAGHLDLEALVKAASRGA